MFTKATIPAEAQTCTGQDRPDESGDRDGRFFMNLLLSAGIAAGAVVGFGVMWDDIHLSNPTVQQTDLLTPPAR
ncbi:MAG: hypothetical protein JSR21_08860 [Proteobacteria bacterium]|nr:hypothetical protein [Pseudomonadota bacterium]